MRSNMQQAEWLINRSLKDGDNRKMRRAINASLKLRRRQGDFAGAAECVRELSRLDRNMRKFRKWKQREHPDQTISVEINVTETV